MLGLVDTHCHLDPHYFPEGPVEVLAQALAAGVSGFVTIGVGSDLTPAKCAIDLATAFPDRIAATVGVHPHDASTYVGSLATELDALASESAICAIGEIGLDYHYDHSPRATQRETFAALIAVARKHKKPIVVHTREAAADTLELLRSEGARDVGGIIHCFSEDRAFAEAALDLDFDLSFSGIVTFKSAKSVHDVAEWAPASRILLETDSPYLAPIPMRGKPCVPAYIVHTARRISELRAVPLEELARVTRENASRRLGRTFLNM